MAAPGGQYFIKDKLHGSARHYESFEALWNTKWKPLCEAGVYPFMFGCAEDFQPVVGRIIEQGLRPPYDWDEYAQAFFPEAEALVRQAGEAETKGNKDEASELYLRASALFRIARFPAPRSTMQALAWEKGKDAAIEGLKLHERPMVQVEIPHSHARDGDGPVLPAFYHLPRPSSSVPDKVPLIIIFTGLDGYRTELAVWKEGWAGVGCATLIVEIPGTGDNPGAPFDPTSPDRVWESMFDWIAKQGRIDQGKIVNWGFSTGGYYSMRLAHTHASKLKGVVALGGGCHHMFDPEWLDTADTLEYPLDLAHTLCHKFGYGKDFDRFKVEARERFSLLSSGLLDRPDCARMLLVNGTEDEIFPIDDCYLSLQHGDPKEARFIPNTKHMGEPMSFVIILKWIFALLDINGDPKQFMKTIPFTPKFTTTRTA